PIRLFVRVITFLRVLARLFCAFAFSIFSFFFFNDTATSEIYTLSLHDALPIYALARLAVDDRVEENDRARRIVVPDVVVHLLEVDRKSTRLNSSHGSISYAVFCLKKKKVYVVFDTMRYRQIW